MPLEPASCYLIVSKNKFTEVLMAQKNVIDHEFGNSSICNNATQWVFPGGLSDPQKDHGQADAAVREFYEETSFKFNSSESNIIPLTHGFGYWFFVVEVGVDYYDLPSVINEAICNKTTQSGELHQVKWVELNKASQFIGFKEGILEEEWVKEQIQIAKNAGVQEDYINRRMRGHSDWFAIAIKALGGV